MRSLIGTSCLSMFLLAAHAGTGLADDAPQAKSYADLVTQFQDERKEYQKSLDRAKTEADRRAAMTAKPNVAEFADRFLELAREKPQTDDGFDAANWVLQRFPTGKKTDAALRLLAGKQVENRRLGPMLPRLAKMDNRAAEDVIRAAFQKSPHREVRAQACYTLATRLIAESRRPLARNDSGDDDLHSKPREEAEALLKKLHDDFGDVALGNKTYGALAKEGQVRLNEKVKVRSRPTMPVRGGGGGGGAGGLGGAGGAGGQPVAYKDTRLTVGTKAPEIIGKDTNGRDMKLSDYKGSVIVLSFWGQWCPYCHDIYPIGKSLGYRFMGESVVHLGVNNDADLSSVRALIAREGIKWPSWWDAENGGPIASSYGVRRWPATFIIDAQGIIRYRNVDGILDGKAIEAAVEAVLKNKTQPAEPEKKKSELQLECFETDRRTVISQEGQRNIAAQQKGTLKDWWQPGFPRFDIRRSWRAEKSKVHAETSVPLERRREPLEPP